MTPKSYNNPPIVEAVVEVHLAPSAPWSEDVLKDVVEHLRPLYPGASRRQNRFNFQANFQEPVSTSSKVIFVKEVLPTADGKALVGVGENLLSIHVVAPYPGWESFISRAKDAIAIYREVTQPVGLSQVAVRYVDQILIPRSENLDLAQYLPAIPPRAASMPALLDAFHVVTQTRDVADNFSATLTIASQLSTDGHLPVLYDLALARQFAAPVAVSEFEENATFLHARQRVIFEDSITEMTRRLFS